VLFLVELLALELPWVTVSMGVGTEPSYHFLVIFQCRIAVYSMLFHKTVQQTGHTSQNLEAVLEIHAATP